MWNPWNLTFEQLLSIFFLFVAVVLVLYVFLSELQRIRTAVERILALLYRDQDRE